jgi:hypothetical protein
MQVVQLNKSTEDMLCALRSVAAHDLAAAQLLRQLEVERKGAAGQGVGLQQQNLLA